MSISLLFLILALICFILATIPIATGRVNVFALGFVFWVLSILITGGGLAIR